MVKKYQDGGLELYFYGQESCVLFVSVCDAGTTILCSTSSIKKVIDRNDGEEKVCDEKDGWCLPHTTDNLRDIISAMIKKIIRAQKPSKEQPRQQHPRAMGPIIHLAAILVLNASWVGGPRKTPKMTKAHASSSVIKVS